MIYQYKCVDCDYITDSSRAMEDRNLPCECYQCGGDTKHHITGGQGFARVMGGADMPGYHCPVTDQFVDSTKKRREIMASHDLVEAPSADGKGVHRV